MSYEKKPEGVVITLTPEEYSELILLLGFATATALREKGMNWARCARIINAVNEGNPNWTPYPTEDKL